MEKELQRVDPIDCGCTDCITGYSKPINICNDGELLLLYLGGLQNASGQKVTMEVKMSYK